MLKQKQKKLVKKIILSAVLGLLLFFTAPASITNNRAFAEESAQDQACKTTLGKICSEVSKTEYEAKCQAYDGCEGYTKFLEKTGAQSGSSNSPIDLETAKDQISFLVAAQKFLNRLIWPILFMIGGLMDNSLLFGSGMESRLREIWIPIRNIVNMLFVIVLVGIALYNVLGIGDENGSYSIKAILPKIVVGIIAVNFSFIGIKVFLDAINVLTVSIFTLPSQVDEGLGRIITDSKQDEPTIKRICAAFRSSEAQDITDDAKLKEIDKAAVHRAVAGIFQNHKDYAAKFTNKINPTDTWQQIDEKVQTALAGDQAALDEYNKELTAGENGQICKGNVFGEAGKGFLSRWNSRNAALAMAINMGKIVYYEDVPVDVKNLEQLAINTIFSFMMWLIYAASFIALFVVLLARLVVMWLAIALSPVLLLMLAVPAIKESISGFGDIQSKFVQNAIAPLGIALSMTIGWVMLRALQGINSIGSDSILTFNSTGPTIPVVGISTLQDLIVALGTVAVVWMGVFTAASSSIAAPVTDWMKTQLSNAGSFIGNLPLKHIPLVPITIKGQKDTYTAEQVMEGLRTIGDTSSTRRKLADKLGTPRTDMDSWRTNPSHFTDGKSLARLFNANDKDLTAGDKATIDELIRLRKDSPAAWRDLIASHPQGRQIDKAIDDYTKKPNPTDDDRKALGKEVVRLSPQIDRGRYDGRSGSSGPTAPGTAPTAPQPITATSPVGRSTIGAGLTPPMAAARATAMQGDVTRLGAAINDPTQANKSALTALIQGMNPAFRTWKAADLQRYLGSADYDQLKKLFDNSDANIEAALKKANGTAPAPGGGGTPGGGTPGTGGGTGPVPPPMPPAPAPQPNPTNTNQPPAPPGP